MTENVNIDVRTIDAPPDGAAGLCYPRILRSWSAGSVFLGTAAYCGEDLVGLAVCGEPWSDPDGARSVRLVSVAVRGDRRRQGIAQQLVSAAIAQAAATGAERMIAIYSTLTLEHPIVASILTKTGWFEPEIHEYRIAGTPIGVARAAESSHRAVDALLHRGFASDAWARITASDEAQMRAELESARAAKPFDPFPLAGDCDPELSIVLRAHGVVVGWILATRQSDGTTVYYTNGWVSEPYQRMGWLLGGLFDVCRTQGELIGPDSLAVYATAGTNAAMHAFMLRRLGPICSWNDTRYIARRALRDTPLAS